MGSAKRNLLTSILLLVVMGVFAVLTIFIVVDAINKKYYNDIKVEYEVQEEEDLNNVILTFARNEGSAYSIETVKAVRNPEDKTKFRIDGTVPTIENGIVTNLDDLTSSDGREFYFFSTNSSFIDPQEDPENPDFIFSETDSRYYVSTEDNPIWYDVPKSSENLTLYSVFLTPNVHNSDFANAPLLNTSPNVIISHDVTEIPYNAFSNAFMEGDLSMAAKIESVVIPNTTKSINSEMDENIGGAFAGCTTLTDIIIPSSVEYVGGEAFMLCSGLDAVEYGNGCYLSTENNEHAILVDTNLKAENVTIHETCISIQGGTFSKILLIELGLIPPPDMGDGSNIEELLGNYINMNLQKITIPKNVKNIGTGAFGSCIGLENVVFEDNSDLTSIGLGSFLGCSNLKTINLEVTKLEELTGSFTGCSSLISITIPESVTSIGEGAFFGCSSLKTVNFEGESQLTSIGERAFSYCSSLTSITIPDSVTSIGERAFISCSSLTSITIPDSVTSIGGSTFEGCSSLTSITIPSRVTSIGSSTFRDCSSLTSITIPDSVTSIGEDAFYSCDSLTSITIPDSVTSIGRYAFSYCSSLTSITIPDSVTSIGSSAFESCSSLTSITIPDSVTSIEGYAFNNCSSLETVTFGDNSQLKSIGERAFSYCSSLTSITIPDSVTSIGSSAFSGCSSLTSITIPDRVTSIGRSAFSGCSSLTSITIPDSVTSIGYEAFRYCSSLTSITIPESVTSIGSLAFSGCSSLTSITIPDSVTSIVSYTFAGCSSLTSITIPEGVTSIGNNAFDDCSSLTSITIPGSVTSIGEWAFTDCRSLTSIIIPSSVTSIGDHAFSGCYKLVEVYDLTGNEGLNITAGSGDNGSVGRYADYVYTDKDTDLVQEEVGDYIFYYNNDIMYLLSYTGSKKELTLPSIDKVKEVFKDFSGDTYEIYEYAFYENSNITSVVILDSVTSIGNSAFRDCSSLTSITIPDSVRSIGSSAFSGCSSLTSITIPDSVTSIEGYAFYNCSSLTSITIPSGVTSIGYNAFYGCSSLTIYCEASSQPSGWNSGWNSSNRPVYWAGEWKYVDEVPPPIE